MSLKEISKYTDIELMEKSVMDLEEFGFGLFDDVPDGVTHPLLIDDFEDEAEAIRKLKVVNVYKFEKGSTQLHRAIRDGKKLQIKLLIEAYREDFDKVRSYLEKKYQWDQADPIWLKKTILVANSEEECRAAKGLETNGIGSEDLRKAIFVLLQHAVEDEEVAMLHPDESTRLSAVQLINQLIPNGFLSWSCIEPEGKHQTFMETAAEQGLHDVIDRLHELGAPITIPDHNPLIIACEASRKDTIRWLLTQHFDSFDCSLRNQHQLNALIMAMLKNDPKTFDLCLEKMIAYRCKYYRETESEAFSNVFRYENEETATMSIFNFYRKGKVISGAIDRAIARYGVDLRYQWREHTTLASMLTRSVSLEYCYESIRKNPELLGIVVYGSTTVLHEAIKFQHVEFLCEMYRRNPEIKRYFNSEAGYETFRTALYNKNQKVAQFIVEHHMGFLRSDEQKLKDIVCICGCSKEHYEQHYELFMKYLPELKEDIEQTKEQAYSEKYLCLNGIERSFADVGIDVSNIDDLPKPLSSLRASKGETLLHFAVEKDIQELFLKLINAKCDLDTLDNEGNHPIHFIQSKAMLNLILDRQSDGRKLVQLTNQDGFSVLHKICSLRIEDEPLLSMLEKVIDLGADVHQLTNEGESVVFFLTSTSALEVLSKHNVPDIATKDGETALLRHLREGNYNMARALLKYVHQLATFEDHAHKYLEPMLGRSRLFLEEYPATTKLIFDSLYKHSRDEASRLFNRVCAGADDFALEKFLEFDYDLDYNYQDEYQNTPIIGLFRYMDEPNKHIVERLLKKGVDLHTKSNWGQDALMVLVDRFRTAVWYGHDAGTVQLLLDYGAAVNTTDAEGNTPLYLAFKEGDGELIEVLIRNGANADLLKTYPSLEEIRPAFREMENDEYGFALNYESSDEDEVNAETEDSELRLSNIYAPENGSTQLFQLIRSGNQRRIVELIDAYGADFAKVRKHLKRKYRWKSDDKIWLRKTILVASSEEQCRRAKGFEDKAEDLQKAVFVLLQHPVDGEELAILCPDESNRLSVAQLIIDLIPNGFLTWKNIAACGETFMEAAAACGLHEVIDKLFELGDPIAIPDHNPLLQACEYSRKDTIHWLLTNHFDDFDCTLRDGSQYNALIVALRRNDPRMVQLLLDKMVAYRRKHYHESETEAFNQIFRYESADSDDSIFIFLWRRKEMYEVIEKAVTEYKLDLSYRWKNVTNLENLISYGIALDYCFQGIRANPELLGLATCKFTTILHELLNKRHLDFLRELHRKHPSTKRYFNNEAGLPALQQALISEEREAIGFILEHYREHLESDINKLKEEVVCSQHCSKRYFDSRLELFKEFFPIFMDEIERIRMDKAEQQYSTEIPSPEDLPEHQSNIDSDHRSSKPTLHEAVQANDLDLFLHLMEGGHDIDTLDNEGNHPIHFVQSEAMLDLVISRHPDGPKVVQRTDPAGCSVLHKICSLRMDHKTMIDLMETVIGYGADVHQRTKNGDSIAFFVESLKVFQYLKKFDIKLDAVNAEGETALERHLYNENFIMARELLVLTYKLPTFKDHARKVLDLMMKNSRYLFTQHYQDLLEKYSEMTRTIFDSFYDHSKQEASQLFAKAARNGFYFIVEKFLEFDYDLNYDFIYKEEDDDGESTPLLNLITSSEKLQVSLIEQLLEKDVVDVNFRNNSGRNALLELVYRHRFVSRKEDFEKLIRLMIKRGSSVDCVDPDGNTALHWVFLSSSLDLVLDLIQMGADLRISNNYGKIPLEMADKVTQELFYFMS